MAKLMISQKSGLGTVKEIIAFIRGFDCLISDIKVTKSGSVIFYSDYFTLKLPEELKRQTKGIKYDPSNGKHWLPKKTVKKQHTLARWE